MLAGVLAGVVEATTCMTPMHCIQIKTQQRALGSLPPFRGLLDAITCRALPPDAFGVPTLASDDTGAKQRRDPRQQRTQPVWMGATRPRPVRTRWWWPGSP